MRVGDAIRLDCESFDDQAGTGTGTTD